MLLDNFFSTAQLFFVVVPLFADLSNQQQPEEALFSSTLSQDHHVVRHRRATPSGDAVLLYSTQDAIFELPFKSASSAINVADFRKIFSSSQYAVEAFSATYREGDNLLLYGKGELYSRPIRSGSSYLYGEDVALGKEFNFEKSVGGNGSGLFVADWVDYNVYTVYKGQLSMIGLTSHFRKVVYNISESARNLVVEQTAHLVAWIANDVNLVKMNKDGSSQATVWTEEHRHILCMTTDPDRHRFFFFVPDIQKLQSAEEAKFALFFSIAYEGEDQPVREGAIKYSGMGSSVLAVAKYYDRVFVVLLEKRTTGAGDQLYKIVEVKKGSDENMAESIMVSASWPITDLQVAWSYKDQPDDCNKAKNRCPYLCAHLYDDKTPMCLCREDASADCKPYKMTNTPPPTRAVARPNENVGPAKSSSSLEGSLITWASIGLVVAFIALGGYLLYVYVYSAEEEGEGGEEGGEGGEGMPAEGMAEEGAVIATDGTATPVQTTGSTTGTTAAEQWDEEQTVVGKKKKKKRKDKKRKKKKRATEETSGTGTSDQSEGSTKKQKKKKKSAEEKEASQKRQALTSSLADKFSTDETSKTSKKSKRPSHRSVS